MMPKPNISSDGSSAKPRFPSETPAGPAPRRSPARGSVAGRARRGIAATSPSKSFTPAATTAPANRTRSRATASTPWLWICCIVSAVATPAGKRRRSRSSIWLRSPAATTMPSALTENTQKISSGQGRICPVRSVKAGMGATRPPEMIEAADDAAVWLMLFS